VTDATQVPGVTVDTNGKTHFAWPKVVGWFASATLGIVVWLWLEMNGRVRELERADASKSNSISVLQQLRPEDKELMRAIAESSRTDSERLRRLEINVARILAKLDIEEAH
jgi:hypothetical protein